MYFPPVRKTSDFLGRIFLATTFAVAIPTKILNFPSVVSSISSKGIPDFVAAFLLVCAILCLICGVGYLLFGQDQRIGPALLLIFLIPTTLIMHTFPFQPLAIYMNLGLIGGLTIALSRANLTKEGK